MLRADIHKLFDNYQLGIHPQTMVVFVSTELLESDYEKLNGKKLALAEGISKSALQYRWQYFTERNECNTVKL